MNMPVKHQDFNPSRRNILRAAPAAGLAAMMAGAVPATASASETPVAALFREWTKRNADLLVAFAASRDDNDEACESAFSARYDVEKRLMALPCQNATDWLMKVTAWTDHGDGCCQDKCENPALWNEAKALIGGSV